MAYKTNNEPVVLKRQLGLWSCIALTVGPIIGSGIWISPKGILQNCGGSVGCALMMWVVCGIIATLGALTVAELSTMIRKSGGVFIYLITAYNKYLGFLNIYCFIMVIRPASNVIVSITMGKYFLSPFFSGCESQMHLSAVKLVAVITLTLVVALNIYSVPWSYRAEIFVDIAKICGLLMIIVMGILRLVQGHTENFQGAFSSPVSLSTLPLAFYSGMWAYGGWQFMPAIIEEVKDPARNIPLATIISMSVITGLYMFTNVAYFSVLSADQLLTSGAVASDFAIVMLGDWAWIVQILVGLSCFSNRLSITFSSARIMFIGAREGVLPEIFSMISIRRLTPVPTIIALHILSMVMLSSSNIYSLINYLSFTGWLFMIFAACIVPYYRWKYPEMHRPYKVPLICPIVFIICLLVAVAFSLYSAPVDCGIGLAMVLSAIPVYVVCVYWKNKPKCVLNAITRSTHFLQKLMLAIHQEAKTY